MNIWTSFKKSSIA